MSWLCQCGTGRLLGDPPEYCPLCGFPLWDYFGILNDFEEEEGNEKNN